MLLTPVVVSPGVVDLGETSRLKEEAEKYESWTAVGADTILWDMVYLPTVG